MGGFAVVADWERPVEGGITDRMMALVPHRASAGIRTHRTPTAALAEGRTVEVAPKESWEVVTRGPFAIVGYSGALAGPAHLPGALKCRPPILLVHGDRDDVVPFECLAEAREGLAAAGLGVEWHVARGLGHGIDPEGLGLGGRFLANAGTSRGERNG